MVGAHFSALDSIQGLKGVDHDNVYLFHRQRARLVGPSGNAARSD
jgi:hypothetical protein